MEHNPFGGIKLEQSYFTQLQVKMNNSGFDFSKAIKKMRAHTWEMELEYIITC